MVFYRDLYSTKREFVFSVLQILLLAVINIALPLWLCFAFYFGVWHSTLSFDMIRRDLKLENNLFGWWILVKKALPYATVAWGGILLFIIFRADTRDLMEVFHLFFIGIAVLTLPHLQVFTKLKVSE
jgi:Brp/Blh family beta-carotene 15,15'-monooxygenase